VNAGARGKHLAPEGRGYEVHTVGYVRGRTPMMIIAGLLAALLGVIPKARRQGLRLLVTPDTIVRWHRDIARRRWAARSMRGRTGRLTTRRNIQALPEPAFACQ